MSSKGSSDGNSSSDEESSSTSSSYSSSSNSDDSSVEGMKLKIQILQSKMALQQKLKRKKKRNKKESKKRNKKSKKKSRRSSSSRSSKKSRNKKSSSASNMLVNVSGNPDPDPSLASTNSNTTVNPPPVAVPAASLNSNSWGNSSRSSWGNINQPTSSSASWNNTNTTGSTRSNTWGNPHPDSWNNTNTTGSTRSNTRGNPHPDSWNNTNTTGSTRSNTWGNPHPDSSSNTNMNESTRSNTWGNPPPDYNGNTSLSRYAPSGQHSFHRINHQHHRYKYDRNYSMNTTNLGAGRGSRGRGMGRGINATRPAWQTREPVEPSADTTRKIECTNEFMMRSLKDLNLVHTVPKDRLNNYMNRQGKRIGLLVHATAALSSQELKKFLGKQEIGLRQHHMEITKWIKVQKEVPTYAHVTSMLRMFVHDFDAKFKEHSSDIVHGVNGRKCVECIRFQVMRHLQSEPMVKFMEPNEWLHAKEWKNQLSERNINTYEGWLNEMRVCTKFPNVVTFGDYETSLEGNKARVLTRDKFEEILRDARPEPTDVVILDDEISHSTTDRTLSTNNHNTSSSGSSRLQPSDTNTNVASYTNSTIDLSSSSNIISRVAPTILPSGVTPDTSNRDMPPPNAVSIQPHATNVTGIPVRCIPSSVPAPVQSPPVAASVQSPSTVTATVQFPSTVSADVQSTSPVAASVQSPSPVAATVQTPSTVTATVQSTSPVAASVQSPSTVTATVQEPAESVSGVPPVAATASVLQTNVDVEENTYPKWLINKRLMKDQYTNFRQDFDDGWDIQDEYDVETQDKYTYNNAVYRSIYRSVNSYSERHCTAGVNVDDVYKHFRKIMGNYKFEKYDEVIESTVEEFKKIREQFYSSGSAQATFTNATEEDLDAWYRNEVTLVTEFLIKLKEHMFFDLGFYLDKITTCEHTKAKRNMALCACPCGKVSRPWTMEMNLCEHVKNNRCNIRKLNSAAQLSEHLKKYATQGCIYHLSTKLFLEKVHDIENLDTYKVSLFDELVSCSDTLFSITRDDGLKRFFYVHNIYDMGYMFKFESLKEENLKEFFHQTMRASAQPTSTSTRGKSNNMYIIGSTIGASRSPRLKTGVDKHGKELFTMLPRPVVQCRDGQEGHKYMTQLWYLRLVRQIGNIVRRYVHHLSKLYDEYKQIWNDICYVDEYLPSEFKLGDSPFTQAIFFRNKDGTNYVHPHFDPGDIVTAILAFGWLKSGGETNYFSECVLPKDINEEKLKKVHSVPFKNGLLQIGSYDDILHSVSKWEGELYFLNLHTNRKLVYSYRDNKNIRKACRQFKKDGFPTGEYDVTL